MVNICVTYCPQPEEDDDSSAAYDFARRATGLALRGETADDVLESNILSQIERLSVEGFENVYLRDGWRSKQIDERKDVLKEETFEDGVNDSSISSSSSILCIFLISCSADGSVDRNIRKLVRSMKNSPKNIHSSTDDNNNKNNNNNNSSIRTMYVATALLGHARCETSAKQMEDTIFNHGRKFHQSLLQRFPSKQEGDAEMGQETIQVLKDHFETHVELEGPDEEGGFDTWIQNHISNSSQASL